MSVRNDKIGNKKKTKKAPLGFTDPWSASAAQAAPPHGTAQPRESDSKKAGAGKILVAAAAGFN